MLKYHIKTIELSSAAASIDFSSIPQTFTDLLVFCSLRGSGSGASDTAINMWFNGTTTNRSSRTLYANGSSASSFTDGPIGFYGLVNSSMTANTFCNSSLYIPNYAGDRNKTVSIDSTGENNATRSDMSLTVGLWSSTAAITQVTIAPYGAFNFASGSSISLYGITRGSDGRTEVASGGVITTSGGYTIHTFNTSGTFVPNRTLDVEYLVVAGGGGGGRYGGGGGAGGYRSSVPGELSGGNSAPEPKLTLLGSTSYPVIVGAGGSGHLGDAQSGGTGIEGTSSSLSTITSVGGGGGGNYGNNSYGVGSLGGSSGGGGCTNTVTNPLVSQSPVEGQGFVGGTGGYQYFGNSGGGGGGAGQAGFAGNATGKGGAGLSSIISGSLAIRGGGGSGSQPSSTLSGGDGGGGSGIRDGATVAASLIDGQANTGGGGGGTRDNPVTGLRQRAGSGGSGVVIIRYLTP
jgi:hypothetical protein